MNTYDVCKKAHSGDKMNGRTLVYNNELTGLIGFGGNVNSFSCSELEDKLTNRFVIFANATPLKYGPVYWISADSGVYSDAAVQFTAADKSWLATNDNAPDLDPGADDFLICLWMWADSLVSGAHVLIKGLSSTGVGALGYSMNAYSGSQIRFSFGDGNSSLVVTNVLSPPGSIATGKWHFIAIHADRDGDLRLLIDNIMAASADMSDRTGDVAVPTGPFVIGTAKRGFTMTPPDGMFFDGRIDSLMFFKKPDLSPHAADIIAWAYNGGQGRLCAEITDEQKAAWGAISGYELNEREGLRYDSWGSNHLSQAFSTRVINGTFTGNADGWTLGANWAYGTNNIAATAATESVTQALTAVVGKLYTVTYTIGGSVSGSVRFEFGGVNGTTRTAAGTYSETIRATATGTNLVIAPQTVFTGTVDDVIVTAAEILAAPGIVRGQAADSNFAVQLNGTSQYLNYTGAAFDPGVGDFSVGCAFYISALPLAGKSSMLLGAGTWGTDSDFWWVLFQPDGSLIGRFNDGSGILNHTYCSAGTVTAGVWYTIVATYDRDGNATLNLNGVTLTPQSISSWQGDIASGSLYLGSLPGSVSSYAVAGRIDNAFYANRLLTADEIAYMHNNGKWRQYAEIAADQPSLASAMKGFWEFDNASNLGLDSTANGLNLTPTASPLRGPGVNYLEGVVGHWVDQSRNVIASQTTLSKRPAFISNALNGKPVIRFDGIDDVLGFTSSSLGTKNKTIIVVAKSPSNPSGIQGVLSNGTTNWYVGYDSTTIGKTSHAKTDTTQQTTDSSANFLSTTDFIIQVYRWNVVDETVEVSFFKNGILHGTTTYSSGVSSTVGSSWFIGAFNATSLFFHGDIAELMVFDRVLTDAQFRYIHTYLSTKYNL